jgi:hypothetical protein
MDQLTNENTLTLILNCIIILALLSTRMRGLRSLFRSRLGNVEIELDSQFARLEQEIRTHLSQHATKNAHIIVLLVIDHQEVKELARVPIGHCPANE